MTILICYCFRLSFLHLLLHPYSPHHTVLLLLLLMRQRAHQQQLKQQHHQAQTK